MHMSSFDKNSGLLTLTFAEPTNSIEAGVPYIVKWETTSTTPLTTPMEFKGATIHNSVIDTKTTTTNINFCGVFSLAFQ